MTWSIFETMKISRQPSTTELGKQEKKDLKILAMFTAAYCGARHDGTKTSLSVSEPGLQGVGLERFRLCNECREFLDYAFSRRIKCPLDPKPTCKHCPVHCYRPGHREKVREIMRFSGRRLILRGRLDLLWHYFF